MFYGFGILPVMTQMASVCACIRGCVRVRVIERGDLRIRMRVRVSVCCMCMCLQVCVWCMRMC